MIFSASSKRGPVATTTGRRPTRRGGGLWLLAGAGLFVLGLLAGLYLFFPAETLKQRIIQETDDRTEARLQIGSLSLYPLLALHAEEIGIELDKLSEPLKIDSLTITPQWSTLLSDPGAHIEVSGMSGTATAVITKSGTLSVDAAGLQFDLPLLEPIPCTISGTINEAKIDTATYLHTDTKIRLSLRVSNARILGLAGFDADKRGIAIGEVSLLAEGKGRNLEVTSLSATGGALDVSGQGTLFIGRTAATSRIRLDLEAKPGPNADPNITTLLQLAGEADQNGRYSLQLTGTLTKPNLKSGG
jgi:type II secretion system protein N